MGRAPCCEKNGLKKGPWTPEEDQKLIDYIQEHGYGNWRTLPKNAGLQRCGKSCRLRWTNYLRPDIKRGKFSFEEEETIIQLHSILGNKWSAIAARLPGRTDNEIKNYWNTHIRKKMLRMGIDPVTHSPRLDLLDLNTILNASSLFANYPQMNLSRLLGLQSYVNPELIRLASSLFSSQLQINQGYSHVQTNNLNLVQNQAISHNPQGSVQTPVHNTAIVPSTACLDAPACNVNPVTKYDDVLDFQENLAGFGLQNCSGSEFVPGTNYGYYGSSGQTVVDPDPSSDQASTFQSSNNFSVLSNTSSHSSSSAPLNSSYGEDIERESYCSNLLKFDIPGVLDVNDYL